MKEQNIILITLIGVAAALVAESSNAQSDCAIDGNKPPHLAVSATRVSSSSFENNAPGARVLDAERQLSAGLNRVRMGQLCVDLSVDYQYTRYEYVGVESRNRDLHRLQVPLHFWSQRGEWRYRGYLAPGIASSSNVFKDFFKRGGRDDLYLSSRFEASRLFDQMELFVGIAYDRAFGQSKLYPVAGAELITNGKLRLRLAYPDPGLRYEASARQSISVRLFPAGQVWHVTADDFRSDFDYRVEALRSQLTWSMNLWRELAIDISGGYEFGREHNFTDDRGVRIDAEVDDQWLFAIGFRVGASPLSRSNGVGMDVHDGADVQF